MTVASFIYEVKSFFNSELIYEIENIIVKFKSNSRINIAFS